MGPRVRRAGDPSEQEDAERRQTVQRPDVHGEHAAPALLGRQKLKQGVSGVELHDAAHAGDRQHRIGEPGLANVGERDEG